jgi:hypothetical protein
MLLQLDHSRSGTAAPAGATDRARYAVLSLLPCFVISLILGNLTFLVSHDDRASDA